MIKIPPILLWERRGTCMVTKHPPVLSRRASPLLVRVPGAPEVMTLGADMPNVTAKVASAGEVNVSGVVARGV